MRTLLVEGAKTFKIEVPDDAKITFGPWSPPNKRGLYNTEGGPTGTLRIYRGTKENIIGCFAGVTGFRELSAVHYMEQVAKEEGASIWKSDHEGYSREDRVVAKKEWVKEPALIAAPSTAEAKKKKPIPR